MKKIQRLTKAALDREDCIFEYSNAQMEEADMSTSNSELQLLNSDPKDALESNKVKYSCNDEDNDSD